MDWAIVFYSGRSYTITCGEHLLNTYEIGQITFDVTEVIIHPDYRGADKGYDIAVFKVSNNAIIFFFTKCSKH